MDSYLEKPRILLVDDDKPNLKVTAAALRRSYDVVTAESGEDALELVHKQAFPLIIADYKMLPGEMSGLDFLKQVPNDPPNIRMILTGQVQREDVIDALNSGVVYRLISKPWNEDELLNTIAQGLETLRLRLENEHLLEELREANELLEEKVRQRTRQIEEQHQQLIRTEKMAALGQITPVIAHEVNTPLGAVIGIIENMSLSLPRLLQEFPTWLHQYPEAVQQLFLQLTAQDNVAQRPGDSRSERTARRELTEDLEEAGLESAEDMAEALVKSGLACPLDTFLPLLKHMDADSGPFIRYVSQIGGLWHQMESMHSAAQRVNDRIQVLKDYVHKRQDPSQPTEVDLPKNLETVLTLFDYYIHQGIELERNWAADLPTVVGWPEELVQLWTNLIMNAIQAMDGHGRLQIDIAPEGTGVQIDITDTGPGIPPELQERIFESLFTTKPAGQGSGLGLTICQDVVELHGGRLSFTSESGQTTFTVWLPREQPTNA